jgi:hypothetical protein
MQAFLATSRFLEACAHDVTLEQSIQAETLEVLFAGLLKCIKYSFLCTAFAFNFLKKRDVGVSTSTRQVS